MDHEKLHVYKLSLEYVARAVKITGALPRGNADLADQLKRSSMSISQNIAEGAGEFSPRDKARFYRIARRSATESAASLDCCHLVDASIPIAEEKAMLARIIAMLVGLIRAGDVAVDQPPP